MEGMTRPRAESEMNRSMADATGADAIATSRRQMDTVNSRGSSLFFLISVFGYPDDGFRGS
jgi:hypothetical protein